MFNWLKIALGNIWKNKRRSFVTILAVAFGFAAVSLFRGYIHNVYDGLRNSAIRGEGLGHLTLYKKGWLLGGKLDPDKYMFTKDEMNTIERLLKKEADVVLVTPQLRISGLASNGRVSTIFLAAGVIPADELVIQGSWANVRPVIGKPLSDENAYGVEMARDLAAILNLEPGDDGVVMATTPEGQMNALDILVSGVFDSGSENTNDKYMRVPFTFAQSLYDTDKADRMVILLDDWKKTEVARSKLQTILGDAGLQCEIKSWDELSIFYARVKGMFGMIFMFIFTIVLVVVTMSVVNTMGMAVLERTREIGTLRAIGVKRRGISSLFAIEGALLGFMGSCFGIFLNIIVWLGVRMADIRYVPPGRSSEVSLVVDLLPPVMFRLTLFMVFLSLLASILPARRAARLNVVNALGHV